MKFLLIAGVAALSVLIAAADKAGPPPRDGEAVWSASLPIHSPR